MLFKTHLENHALGRAVLNPWSSKQNYVSYCMHEEMKARRR